MKDFKHLTHQPRTEDAFMFLLFQYKTVQHASSTSLPFRALTFDTGFSQVDEVRRQDLRHTSNFGADNL